MAKVLVIDDEATIRELYDFIFSDAGHEVLQAANGLAALELLKSQTPDFMIVDVSMPVMTGREFVMELGARAAQNPVLDAIPFVVMTGENFMDPGLNGCFASRPGFVGYFPKMVPPEEVLSKVAKVLDGRPGSVKGEERRREERFKWPWGK